MGVKFDYYKNLEAPTIALCNPDETVLAFITAQDRKITYKFNDISEFTCTIPSKIVTWDGENITPSYYNDIESKRLLFIENVGYFQIVDVEEIDEGNIKKKEVKAYSYQYIFTFKKFTLDKGTYNLYNNLNPSDPKTLIGCLSTQVGDWTFSYVNSDLWDKYRTFDLNSDTTLYEFLVNDAENAYECIFLFDFLNKQIRVDTVSGITKSTDIYLSFNNLVKQISVEENSEQIVTAMACYGRDIDIKQVNPLGGDYIYNLSYYKTTKWMKQDLIDTITAWEDLITASQTQFSNTLTQQQIYLDELIVLQGQLTDIQNDYNEADNTRSVRIQQGLDITEITAQMDSLQVQINQKNAEITAKNAQIDSCVNTLQTIKNSLSFENNFTPEQIVTLKKYIIESNYSNTSYIKSDSMTRADIQKQSLELYNQSVSVLSNLCQPRFTFKLDSINFVALEEFKHFSDQLELGCVATIEKADGIHYYPILLEFEFNWDDCEVFSLSFGNRNRLNDSGYTFGDLISKTISTARDIDINLENIKSFNSYKTPLVDLVNGVFDASKNAIVSSSNQDIRFDASGLALRKWDPVNSVFENEQIKMINNEIVFTDDGFNSVKSVLGKIYTVEGGVPVYKGYGLSAEILLGKLVATSNLVIVNENNTVTIDQNGANFINATLSIRNDYNLITLSPSAGFNIKKLSDNSDVLSLDTSGNASFAGTIAAKNGNIGGWNINSNSISSSAESSGITLYSGSSTDTHWIETWNYSTNSGVGIFKDGRIWANNATISGNITATSGSIGGWYIDNDYIGTNNSTNSFALSSAQSSDSRWITANTYGVGVTFSVDKTGKLYATGADISGRITATSGSFSGSIYAGSGNIGGWGISPSYLYYYPGNGRGITLGANGYSMQNEYGGAAIEFMKDDDGFDNGYMKIFMRNNDVGLYINAFDGGLFGNWYYDSLILSSSDVNLKNSISNVPDIYSSLFDNLRPVVFKYNNGKSNRYHTGFISQEVEQAIAKAGLTNQDFAAFARNNSDNKCYLRYGEFIPLNTMQIQMLKPRVTTLEEKLQLAEDKIQELENKIVILEQKI
jgi:hypothetical protein